LRGVFRDQRGVALLITCIVIVVLLLLAGAATDLARAWTAREDLQTAVDSAALAGSRSAVRHVTITVGYGHCNTCCDEDKCWCCCECDPPQTLTGTEKHLIEEGGWKRGTCCDRFLGIEKRGIEYPPETVDNSNTVLDLNWPKLMTPDGGGNKNQSDVTVYDDFRYSPYGPSVRVTALGNIKTALLKLAGIKEVPSHRCGQSTSFYDVIRNGWFTGKNNPPDNACN